MAARIAIELMRSNERGCDPNHKRLNPDPAVTAMVSSFMIVYRSARKARDPVLRMMVIHHALIIRLSLVKIYRHRSGDSARSSRSPFIRSFKAGRRRCRKPGRSCVRRIKRHFRRSRRSCAIIANSSTMFDATLPAENSRYSDATFTTMRSLSPQDE